MIRLILIILFPSEAVSHGNLHQVNLALALCHLPLCPSQIQIPQEGSQSMSMQQKVPLSYQALLSSLMASGTGCILLHLAKADSEVEEIVSAGGFLGKLVVSPSLTLYHVEGH